MKRSSTGGSYGEGAGRPPLRRAAASGNLRAARFTGLVIAVGEVASVRELDGGGRRLTVGDRRGALSEVTVGDSVAVAGVCLTATAAKAAGCPSRSPPKRSHGRPSARSRQGRG